MTILLSYKIVFYLSKDNERIELPLQALYFLATIKLTYVCVTFVFYVYTLFENWAQSTHLYLK